MSSAWPGPDGELTPAALGCGCAGRGSGDAWPPAFDRPAPPIFLMVMPSLSVLSLFVGSVMVCGCSIPAGAQHATAPPAPPQRATASVTLPPAPTAKVASGDSAARAARAKLYVARGEAALAAGMRDTARVAWESALYEDPACTDASVDLARVLVEDGDGLHARSLLMHALQRDPTNPKLLHFSARSRTAPPDSTAQ